MLGQLQRKVVLPPTRLGDNHIAFTSHGTAVMQANCKRNAAWPHLGVYLLIQLRGGCWLTSMHLCVATVISRMHVLG